MRWMESSSRRRRSPSLSLAASSISFPFVHLYWRCLSSAWHCSLQKSSTVLEEETERGQRRRKSEYKSNWNKIIQMSAKRQDKLKKKMEKSARSVSSFLTISISFLPFLLLLWTPNVLLVTAMVVQYVEKRGKKTKDARRKDEARNGAKRMKHYLCGTGRESTRKGISTCETEPSRTEQN